METIWKDGLKNAIYDGIFANMFATLTGGVFLTGFALHLQWIQFSLAPVHGLALILKE